MLTFKAPVTTAEDDILLIYISYISRELLSAHVLGILKVISYVSTLFFFVLFCFYWVGLVLIFFFFFFFFFLFFLPCFTCIFLSLVSFFKEIFVWNFIT